jgi:hypothetical protein
MFGMLVPDRIATGPALLIYGMYATPVPTFMSHPHSYFCAMLQDFRLYIRAAGHALPRRDGLHVPDRW